MKAPDPLARALLDVLVSRVSEITRELRRLNAALEDETANAGELEDVEAAARWAREHGWLLGLVGDRQGAGLLQERHEPRGLSMTLELVVQALARRQRVLEVLGDVPELTPRGGAELCWSLAETLWAAAESAPQGVTLRARLVFTGEHARLEVTPGPLHSCFPADWVRAR